MHLTLRACGPQLHRVAATLLTLALLAAGAGCGRHGKAAPVGGSDVPPSQAKLKRNVELARAEQRAQEYHVETVGYLEAENQTDIAAGVSGIVDEVLFREGQVVTPETVLVRIDQRRYQASADMAAANERTADEKVSMAREGERFVRSARQGSTEEEKVMKERATRIAEAELAGARAARVLAEHNLRRSQVRAPYAGQINQRKVTAGAHVEDKTVIATIADLRRLRLVGWIPEKAVGTVRELLRRQEAAQVARQAGSWLAPPRPFAGLAGRVLDDNNLLRAATDSAYGLEFNLQPFPRRSFRARIFYLSTVANPETHLFECKAEVDTRALDVELRPGYTARIRCLLKGNPNACVIPEESVRASERGFIAFVPAPQASKDGQKEWIARARMLELGYRSPGWVEVLKGIEPGEWLVRRGAEALENGTPIRFPDEQLVEMQRKESGARSQESEESVPGGQ